jgi:1-deoxyxylulose-5-phosphate synthase
MGDGVERRGSREYIRNSIEGSLRRLQTDYVDLYQHHEEDAGTPLEETFAALDELVHEGKILVYGTSNYRPEILECARSIAGPAYVSEGANTRGLIAGRKPCCCRRARAWGSASSRTFLLQGAFNRQGSARPSAGARDALGRPGDLGTRLRRGRASRRLGRGARHLAPRGRHRRAGFGAPGGVGYRGASTPEQVRANAAAGGWTPRPDELDELQHLRLRRSGCHRWDRSQFGGAWSPNREEPIRTLRASICARGVPERDATPGWMLSKTLPSPS